MAVVASFTQLESLSRKKGEGIDVHKCQLKKGLGMTLN